jgi:hypothetical protein
MPVQKVSGRAGKFTYNSVVISIKSWKGKVTRELADSTDSSNYDPTSDMLWKAQIPSSVQVEVDIEAYYDLNSTQTSFASQIGTSAGPVAAILGLDATNVFGHGNFDLSDIEVDEEIVDENVSFTATMRSNGVFTFGS